MNSLEDLNTLSENTEVEYTDNRDPQLIFDRASASATTITVTEGQAHTVPKTIEIIEVVNYDEMTSFWEIDISEATGAIISWPTLPAHMTSSIPSTGVYRLEGFRTALDWQQVRSATVNLPNALTGEFEYTSTLGYTVDGTTVEKTTTVSLTIEESDLFTAASDFFWNISNTALITGHPQVQDEGISSPTYSITITPSDLTAVSSFSSTGTGGASSYNAVTKVLSISGTKAQVNSHLENISFVSTATAVNFSLTYVVTSSLSETDTKVQQMKCSDIRYLSLLSTPTITYNEDTSTAVSGGPTITDIDYDGSGTYVMSITGPGVKTLSATGSGGSATFNSGTKILSIVGTRSEVNSYINNITMFPVADRDSNFNLTYTVTTPRAATQAKAQAMSIGTVDNEISGIAGVTRYYAKNTATYIFGNTTYIDTSGNTQTLAQTTPQIIDLDPEPVTYVVTLSVSSSYMFSIDNVSQNNSISISGTKAQVNSQLSGIRFYGIKNGTGSPTITWSQTKNGSFHYSTTFVLTAVDTGGTTFQRDYVITSTQSWIPYIDSRRYSSNSNIVLIGGGGAGTTGAGGGAGGVRIITASTLISTSTYTTYPVTIGAGGTPVNGYNLNEQQLATMAGGTTTGFSQSAPGGQGGKYLRNSSTENYFIGGSAGTYNGAPGNQAQTSVYFTDTQIIAQTFGGTGGAGSATSDYSYLGDITFPKRGSNGYYSSGYGWQGGRGGAAIEFPANSNTWYAGGGSGSGGNAEYALGGSQYNINAGPSFFDYTGQEEDNVQTLPYPIKYFGGGGQGRAQGDNPNAYTFSTPNRPTNYQNGIPNKGGGGGASQGSDGGFGGSGVILIQFNP